MCASSKMYMCQKCKNTMCQRMEFPILMVLRKYLFLFSMGSACLSVEAGECIGDVLKVLHNPTALALHIPVYKSSRVGSIDPMLRSAKGTTVSKPLRMAGLFQCKTHIQQKK